MNFSLEGLSSAGGTSEKSGKTVIVLDLQQVEVHPRFAMVLVDRVRHLDGLSGSALGNFWVVEFAKQKDTVEAQF